MAHRRTVPVVTRTEVVRTVDSTEVQAGHPLVLRDLRKDFAGVPALRGVDMVIAPGEIRALVGANGSGKSTLIKILTGYYRPSSVSQLNLGGVEVRCKSVQESYDHGCRAVHQDLALVENQSVADNFAFGAGYPTRSGTVSRRKLRAQVEVALDRVGLAHLDPSTPIAQLPLSSRTGVALARALRHDDDAPARLVILDEPTATLPEDEVHSLLSMVARVADSGIGVLYVSHRLDELYSIATTVTVLRDGRVTLDQPWGAISRSGLASAMLGEDVVAVTHGGQSDRLMAEEPLLEAQRVSADGVDDVSFEVRPGEILGVAGITGSGREALLPVLFGATTRRSGIVNVSGLAVPPGRPSASVRRGVSYVPGDRKEAGVLHGLSAAQNLVISDLREFWRFPVIRRRRERREVASWFSRLRVRPGHASTLPLDLLSGGNQQKVIVGRSLRTHPRVLLLDEPTQGVDVHARADVHREIVAAAGEGVAVIVSSTDVDELVALSDRVLVMRDGRVAATLQRGRITKAAVHDAALAHGVEDEGPA
jgi:ribose transport system ATP-binding protein